MPLADISWTADVALPIFLMLTLGTLQAIYTGLVASRIIQFGTVMQQARVDAVLITKDLKQVFSAKSRNEAHCVINDFLLAEVSSLRDEQGQIEAAGQLRRIASTFEIIILRAWEQTEPMRNGAKVDPVELDRIVTETLDKMRTLVSVIGHVRANYWIILYVPTFERWFSDIRILRRSDCGDCIKNCTSVI